MCIMNISRFSCFLLILTTSVTFGENPQLTGIGQQTFQPIKYQELSLQNPLGVYKYGYETDESLQSQSRNSDGVTRGFYYYVDDKGKSQYVQYTAGNDGFKVQGTTIPVHVHKKISFTPEVEAARKAHEQAYSAVKNRDLEAHKKNAAAVLINTMPPSQISPNKKPKILDLNSVNFNYFNFIPSNPLETVINQFNENPSTPPSKTKPVGEEHEPSTPILTHIKHHTVSIENKNENLIKFLQKFVEMMQEIDNSKASTSTFRPRNTITDIPVLSSTEKNNRTGTKIRKVVRIQPVKYKDLEVSIKNYTESTTTISTTRHVPVSPVKYNSPSLPSKRSNSGETTYSDSSENSYSSTKTEDEYFPSTILTKRSYTRETHQLKSFIKSQVPVSTFKNISSPLTTNKPDSEETTHSESLEDSYSNTPTQTEYIPSTFTTKKSNTGETHQFKSLKKLLFTSESVPETQSKTTDDNNEEIETTTQSNPNFEVLYNLKNQSSNSVPVLKEGTSRPTTERIITSHDVDLLNYRKSLLKNNKPLEDIKEFYIN